MINYNFHAHVQYCITIQYLSCSIDIYRNVKYVKCHNFGKLEEYPILKKQDIWAQVNWT